ncbi:MAG: tetratricopeptide repeat protein [Bacteroidales bacterium]|nr:tetratricopeptide repeat protein [Bacteroidales bacterium]
MKTIDFSYFIERYNAGEMSETEKEWFEKELEGNRKLRDEVEFRKKADHVLKNHDIIQLRSKLAEIEKKRAAEVQGKNHGKNFNMKYAAVIAGLLALGSIAIFTGRNLPDNEIFDRYYKTYEAPSNVRSGQVEIDKQYQDAMDYYVVKEYKIAAELFLKVLEKAPEDMNVTLLYGISNFEQRNYPVAKKSFSKVIDNNNNLQFEDAQWHLAFCYMKTGEQDKAIELFNEIRKSNSIYKQDAKQILRRMR